MSALVFIIIFGVYLAGASPAIAPRDAADMASAALTLGVAHPPGYPLYSVLGRAWLTIFPLGNPAYRLAILSALAAAGAVVLLFGAVRRRRGVWPGLAAAAVWMFSAPLWKFALIQEKYSLHALFVVTLFILSEGDQSSVWRRLRLSGLLIGLGLVNHQSLLLFLPGLFFLWRRNMSLGRAAGVAVAWIAAGLSLYLFLWIRLGALGPALSTALRSQYGAGTLFAGLAVPLTLERTLGLIVWSLKTWAESVSFPAAVAAAVGLIWCWREDGLRPGGLLLGALLSGPLFVVLSRFDVANWVARSILEPAFLVPALAAAVFAGEFVGRLKIGAPWVGLTLVIGSFFLRAPIPERRDDFLAYDYARNLRRAVPPGGALLAGGDTALFGLRWLDLTEPRTPAREVAGAELTDVKAWLAEKAGRSDVFAAGVAPGVLSGRPSSPEGLVAHVGVRPRPFIPIMVLRRPRGWGRDESYARDAKLSYAFASWSSARLLEAQGLTPPETWDLNAVALDPEDYRLE
jgi:hypothetical protein